MDVGLKVRESPTALLHSDIENLDKLLSSLESARKSAMPELMKKIGDIVIRINQELEEIKGLSPELKKGLKEEIEGLKKRGYGLNKKLVNIGLQLDVGPPRVVITSFGGEKQQKENTYEAQTIFKKQVVRKVEESSEKSFDLIEKKFEGLINVEPSREEYNGLFQKWKEGKISTNKLDEEQQRIMREVALQLSQVPRKGLTDEQARLLNYILAHLEAKEDVLAGFTSASAEELERKAHQLEALDYASEHKEEFKSVDEYKKFLDDVVNAATVDQLRGIVVGVFGVGGWSEIEKAVAVDLAEQAAMDSLQIVGDGIRDHFLGIFREMDEEKLEEYFEKAEEESGEGASVEKKTKTMAELMAKKGDAIAKLSEEGRKELEGLIASVLAFSEGYKLSAEEMAKAIKNALERM